MKTTLLQILFFICLIFSSVARANETPPSLDGAIMVEAKEAKAALDADPNIQIIDVRSKLEYAEERLPKAICVTYKEKSKKEVGFDSNLDHWDISKLPADKNTPIMIHCNGSDCWKSYKASFLAVKAGYKKVYWFRTGMPDWQNHNFPVDQ